MRGSPRPAGRSTLINRRRETLSRGAGNGDRFGATVVIERPTQEVFDFLANGEDDAKFSPRVIEIRKVNPGAPGKGAIYASTVKDAGMKTKREFELTEFERPTKIRWRQLSDNAVVVPEGGG